MGNNHSLRDQIKKLPQWIIGAIALVTTIVGFVNLLRGNYFIGITVLCILVFIVILYFLYYWYSETVDSIIEPGKKPYRFAKYRRWVLWGIIVVFAILFAVVGFLLGYNPSREFARSALIGTPTLTMTITPYPTYTPYPTLTRFPTYTAVSKTTLVPTTSPTPSLSPTMEPIRLVFLNWRIFADGQGTLINYRTTTAKTQNAFELSYNMIPNGWVGVSNDINYEKLSNGSGIGFFLMGGGTPETVEIHLVYEPDVDGKGATFSISWPKRSVTTGWEYFEAPFDAFTCWVDTPCPRDGKLDLEDVRIIDFAVSNKLGDIAGPGYVIIDEIHLLH